MTISIFQASEKDVPLLVSLASDIWKEHYTSLIGEAQVSYMIRKFQSEHIFHQQITSAEYTYYIICYDEKPVGYFGITPEDDCIFLSKLYVQKEYRRKGLAKEALKIITDTAQSLHLSKIRLTVNKRNANSIQAYLHLGFIKTADIVTDIGNGFFMDDYIMEYSLP